MTDAELLALVQEALGEESPDDAFTTHEWADMFSLAVEATRKRIKALLKMGRMEHVKVHREGMNGVAQMVSAYRMKD